MSFKEWRTVFNRIQYASYSINYSQGLLWSPCVELHILYEFWRLHCRWPNFLLLDVISVHFHLVFFTHKWIITIWRISGSQLMLLRLWSDYFMCCSPLDIPILGAWFSHNNIYIYIYILYIYIYIYSIINFITNFLPWKLKQQIFIYIMGQIFPKISPQEIL